MSTRDEFGVMRAYPARGSWVDRAKCVDTPTDLFYEPGDVDRAKEICASCEVADQCLAYALACEDLDPYGGHGLWGGLTGREPNRLRRRRDDAA